MIFIGNILVACNGKVGRSLVGETEQHTLLTTGAFALCDRRWLKLIPVVNFINILRAAFAPKFLSRKVTKPNCNFRNMRKTVSHKKGVRKM